MIGCCLPFLGVNANKGCVKVILVKKKKRYLFQIEFERAVNPIMYNI